MKLRVISIFVLVISGLLVANFSSSYAISKEEIQECEDLYAVYLTVGEDQFLLTYQFYKLARTCVTLYNDRIWLYEGEDKYEKIAERLAELTRETLEEKKMQQPEIIIPEWIKSNARSWVLFQTNVVDFAKGIQHMLDVGIIKIPIMEADSERGCDKNKICALPNDYVKYRHSNDLTKDFRTITHTFGDLVGENLISIHSEEIRKDGKFTTDFVLELETGLTDLRNEDGQCCLLYPFIYPLSIHVGSELVGPDTVKTITGEMVTKYKEQERQVLDANSDSGQYREVIDKQTGVVITKTKEMDLGFGPVFEKTSLIQTNIVVNEIRMEHDEIQIPDWIQRVAWFWVEDRISNNEFTTALQFLIEKGIIRV